jgi:hypothetical protein
MDGDAVCPKRRTLIGFAAPRSVIVSLAGSATYFEHEQSQEQASPSTSSTCSRDSPVRFWMRPINSRSLPSTN